MKWIFRKERDRLQRVVNLIPEYVDALVEERAGAELMGDGMDGRSVHGPALWKSEKIEWRIAQILQRDPGGVAPSEGSLHGTGSPPRGRGLSGSEPRRVFLKTTSGCRHG